MDVDEMPPEPRTVKQLFDEKALANRKHILAQDDADESGAAHDGAARDGAVHPNGAGADAKAAEAAGGAGAAATAEKPSEKPLSEAQQAALDAFHTVVGELVSAMEGLKADNTGVLEQCMECEHQKEQQKELEQQTEMEKYVDVAYSREGEEPLPWRFEELRNLYGEESVIHSDCV